MAGAVTGGNCAGTGTITASHNLDDDGTCFTNGSNGSIVVASGQAGLNALGNNGGPTQTMALQAASPAIDAAFSGYCTVPPISNFDQRGYTRPVGAGCDIGAYEYAPAVASAPVAIPALNAWGMLVLTLLAGLGSMYHLRRGT